MEKVATVNKKEFIVHTNRVLKLLGEYDVLRVTNRGEVEYDVKRASVATNRADIVATEDVRGGIVATNVLEYGCGCKRESGESLCKRHGRV